MSAERTTMRQVGKVLCLKLVGGIPIRGIARRIDGAGRLEWCQVAGLSWLPEALTDVA
jgi:hypothetical protein